MNVKAEANSKSSFRARHNSDEAISSNIEQGTSNDEQRTRRLQHSSFDIPCSLFPEGLASSANASLSDRPIASITSK